MSRIAILPYSFSEGARDLANEINRLDPTTRALRLKPRGSTFRGRVGDMLINWGGSGPEDFSRIVGNTTQVLNRPISVAAASDKVQAFIRMAEAGVPLVEWCRDSRVAAEWMDEGCLVYARTRLSGHSGEGIVLCHRDPSSIDGSGNAFVVQNSLPQARLYTKGITAQRREFRIHVMQGNIVGIQQKKRADGYQENPAYSNTVRNYHTGWIYAQQDVMPNRAALMAAKNAVRALGLDFGAVDIITRRDDAWVLEVNTAPGLQGSNLTNYATQFIRLYNSQLVQEMETVSQVLAMPETVPERTMEVPEAIQEVMAPPVAPTPIPAPGQRSRRSSGAQPRHEAFYWATYQGARVVVQYNEEAEGYYLCGWEVPMNAPEITVDLSQEIV